MVFSAGMKVHRPWGYYETLRSSPGWQLKVLVINPGHAISLQKHKHRAEHWTVASGSGLFTVGNKILAKKAGQDVFIKKGQKHRISNNGKKPVTIVEVQFGEIISEDDIIRFEDHYGRA